MDNHFSLEILTELLLMSDVDFYNRFLQDSTHEELFQFLELCPEFLNESITQDPFNPDIDAILDRMALLFEKAN